MAEHFDRPEGHQEELARGGEAAGGQQRPQTPPPPRIQVDDSKAIACYANFCRVTGTPEELIIDFGLNPHPFGIPNEPIPITQRIVTNFYTAKRLLHALQLTIQRHEATFGVLEIDVQKRIRPAFMQAAPPGPPGTAAPQQGT
ncbi:MAG: DUF3467 domain-containing protein [Thermoguttaceae bacterium]|nr:DUF3467 domain-containing protein [Thermoguttaceae bacterium]MDW8080043.1 DUF3467 domain-containing protein [Thermoguttaceae bacterium]